jgi:hypothetical protein
MVDGNAQEREIAGLQRRYQRQPLGGGKSDHHRRHSRPAKASILKKVAGGKPGTVGTCTKPGQPMMYEAAYTDNRGTHHEVLVKADGTETKEYQHTALLIIEKVA